MLFDPATVARGPKRRAHDLPAGAARLTTSAVGLHGVWINGAQVTDAKGFCADPAEPAGRGAALLRGLRPQNFPLPWEATEADALWEASDAGGIRLSRDFSHIPTPPPGC